ncbi:MAG: response regulator [Planctomycetes bacterium]|nr:response regulator [Planctomycetota bacterium]
MSARTTIVRLTSTTASGALAGWASHAFGWGFPVGCVIASLVALASLAFVTYGLSRSSSLALLDLADAAEDVARGEFDRRVPLLGGASARLSRAMRRIVRELRRSRLVRHDLDRVLDRMNCGLLTIGIDRRIRAANEPLARVLGCEPKALVGRPLAELVERGDELVELAAEEHGPVEVTLRAPDGSSVPALLSFSKLGAVGESSDSVCVLQETRALREVEERLQRINVRLWLLNQVTTIALRSRDLDSTLKAIGETIHDAAAFNGVAFAVHDRAERSLRVVAATGIEPTTSVVKEAHGRSTSLLWHVVSQRESMILHLDDTDLDLEDPLLGHVQAAVLGLFPMRVDDRIIGVLALVVKKQPVSIEQFGHEGAELAQHAAALIDHKLTNEALRRSNEERELARLAAEEANRAKSEFLANMSHEIRTPMTAILGYAELVRDDGRADDQTKEFIATILRNGEHLISIINDILDLSKIEAGKMTIERTQCSPVEFAIEVVDMFRRRADDKQIRLGLDLQWPLPRRIDSDPTRLRQILANLIGNAVKFTVQGEVVLTVRRHQDEPRRIVFQVRDSGIGMSARELAEIFKPFSQADSSHTRRFGGTGLGLAISQHLSSMLGGAISVQSRKGVGSTFSLEIDGGESALGDLDRSERDFDRRRSDGKTEAPPESSAVSARVLLAEDGLDNQKLVSHILRKAGVEVTVVENGRLAVDRAFEAVSAGTPFDVILMDMQMPVLDGYSATRELRERGYQLPVIALTAHAMTGDRERCLEAGCDAFLTKPIDRAEMIARVREFAAKRAGAVAGA